MDPWRRELDRRVHYVDGRPEVVRCLEVAELAGSRPAVRATDLVPRITITDDDVEASRVAWPGEPPFMLVHPGARDARRCWPPDRFAAVASELRRAHRFDVLVVGSTRDGHAAREVISALGGDAMDLTGRVSLGGLLGLAARCSIFVGNDSGPQARRCGIRRAPRWASSSTATSPPSVPWWGRHSPDRDLRQRSLSRVWQLGGKRVWPPDLLVDRDQCRPGAPCLRGRAARR